ncbi:hypothetical protein U1701_15140 [Sphingomonas sp. PB2P19]|uniref:hypothetical protein n=1 Tax=Sphingomonas rhamnosi TaxID=3096156 RepID=UPI002FC9F647
MRKAILSLALGASAFTAAAAQDMPMRGPGAAMMRADANGDGIVTRAEALAEAGVRFDRIDANHDGKIDQAELTAIASRRGLRAGQPLAPAVPTK